MADKPRVYPATEDIEKNAGEYETQKPSAPLIPKSSLSSENGEVDPVLVYPHSGGRTSDQFPKDQVIPARELPRYHSPPPKRRSACCRWLCCTFCFLFVLLVIIVITVGILYLAFQPRIPKYSVSNIQITNFSLEYSNLTLSSQFAVKIRARNPNKKIGIYYRDNSRLAVSYLGKELCTGSLPVFYQGHKNTTILDVTLAGSGVQITNDMVSTLSTQRQEGSVPLVLRADVPVKIKFGKLKLKVKVRVRCRLVVNELDANANPRVSAKNCKLVRVRL